jgi:N-acetylmuramoyl-L-alanine amidase
LHGNIPGECHARRVTAEGARGSIRIVNALFSRAVDRIELVQILISFRSALLTCIALTAGTFAPAQAGPSTEPLIPVDSVSFPKIAVPDLLAPEAEPELAAPDEQQSNSGASAGDSADIADVQPTGDLPSMVAQLRSADAGSHELECLATGVYFEAKSEPLAGQLAVGQVIANRAQSGGRFPGTYCGVLFQRGQFSFVHRGHMPSVPHANRQWQTAVAIAKIVDRDLKESNVGNALFFHARYVSPGWRMKRVAAIGNHVFYR